MLSFSFQGKLSATSWHAIDCLPRRGPDPPTIGGYGMHQPEHHRSSSRTSGADEWVRRLTIFLGAPLAMLVSGLALLQFF